MGLFVNMKNLEYHQTLNGCREEALTCSLGSEMYANVSVEEETWGRGQSWRESPPLSVLLLHTFPLVSETVAGPPLFSPAEEK